MSVVLEPISVMPNGNLWFQLGSFLVRVTTFILAEGVVQQGSGAVSVVVTGAREFRHIG